MTTNSVCRRRLAAATRRPARTGFGGRHDRAIRWMLRGQQAQWFAEHNKPEENQRDAGIKEGDGAPPLRAYKPIGFAHERLSNHPRLSNRGGPELFYVEVDRSGQAAGVGGYSGYFRDTFPTA